MTTPKSFHDFKLNPQLIRAVTDLGFKSATEIQQKCIPAMLGGQEVIGIAQTGTGKTAAYMLPLLMKIKYAKGTDPRGLILAPTKELVIQLAEHARQLARYTDLRIHPFFGGAGSKTQIEQLREGVDLLIATPGRFMEIYLMGGLNTRQIGFLVLDEADRMMDMGFMPQLRRILEVIPVKRQNALFSATFPRKVEELCEEFLEFPLKIEITPQATAASGVQQRLYAVPNFKTKINFLAYLLEDSEEFSRVVIFTRTKANANNVFRFLERRDLGPVAVIHSNKGQNTRINAINEFKAGRLRILVSTDVTARGIDVLKVSHVINFDVPIRYEDYVHRIGRTGRAFREGEALTFATPAEMYHIKKIESLIRDQIPLNALPAEVEIAETPLAEKQLMSRSIDNQRRKEDPGFKGAFHEKKNRRRSP